MITRGEVLIKIPVYDQNYFKMGFLGEKIFLSNLFGFYEKSIFCLYKIELSVKSWVKNENLTIFV